MKTEIFTLMPHRKRGILSFFIPLLALFVGLGGGHTAQAQSQYDNAITLTQQPTGQAASTVNYAGRNLDAPYSGYTRLGNSSASPAVPSPLLGTYDLVNTSSLTLNGGVIVAVPPAPRSTATPTSGTLLYRVYLSNTAAGQMPSYSQLALPANGTDSFGDPIFQATNATINLLAGLSTGGTYTADIRFQVNYSDGTTSVDPGTGIYTVSFDVTGPAAPSLTANTVAIAPDTTTRVNYNINPANPPLFQGANLNASTTGGAAYTFDVNTGRLLLNGGTVTTNEGGTKTIGDVVMYYRVRPSAGAGSAYQSITLTQLTGTNGGTKTFGLSNAQLNLIASAAVTAAGTYSLDVYFQANGTDKTTGVPFTITDPNNNGTPYTANFTVTGTPIAQTIWTGGKNDNWFDTANWSNGVPTPTTNALVRDLGAGSAVPYPNINAGVVVRNGTTVLYDNTNSGPAYTRNFTMGGSSQASRSITRLIAGTLVVYGDFSNLYDSFIQRDGSIMEFGGSVSQSISGGTFTSVNISGGGPKVLTGVMNVVTNLTFISGVLYTDITKPTISVVTLAGPSATSSNGAQILGENDNTYLRGFAKTSRTSINLLQNYTFGNLGLELTFTGSNNPVTVDVTRNTVEAYSPVSNKYGIRRIFGVRPGSPFTNSGGLSADMVFHYRTSETMQLNGPDTKTPGTSSIPEPQLLIFSSVNSGNTFGLVGRDGPVDLVNKTVSKSGVRNFATFTLGDQNNPLPVRLTAFDAKRLGNDALVTWQTASEENSKGYDVQVSTDGTIFRTLASVPSASPNTVRLTSYSYTDTESNKSGNRYYRLRQVDLDGKIAFFQPIIVNFNGKAIAANLVAYPNPFNANDELHVALQSATNGKGQLVITDMTGRVIRQQAVELTSGLSDLTVTGVTELKSGLYMVKLTLPTGEVKNLKVVKQ